MFLLNIGGGGSTLTPSQTPEVEARGLAKRIVAEALTPYGGQEVTTVAIVPGGAGVGVNWGEGGWQLRGGGGQRLRATLDGSMGCFGGEIRCLVSLFFACKLFNVRHISA